MENLKNQEGRAMAETPPEKKQEKSKDPVRKETKPLTPEEVRRRRKMLVYPLFFLVFIGAMWLIFAPSGNGEALQEGFNVDVPMPQDKGLPADKRAAYEQNAFERKQKEKMGTLQDLAVSLDDTRQQEEPVFRTETADRGETSPIRSSAAAYRDINRQLGSFYESPPKEDDQKTLELEWRIQELERQAEESRKAKEAGDEQLRLMEKSYEMAARYMPGASQEAKQSAVTSASGKRAVSPVKQVAGQVVSLLAAPMSDGEFMREYGKPRNLGFHTLSESGSQPARNSIRACVSRTVTVKGNGGKDVELRLLEPVQAGEVYIPAGTALTGTAKISGERMEIAVTSIAYKGAIVPVELDVYDTSGLKGVPVPGSEELTALKEMAANMGSTMGSSINISTDAGAQLASDLGRGVIQGASQYLSTKFRTAKATLKAGYEVLLVSKE